MIGIAILDDDSRVREALNAHLTRFARREGLELQIRSFESGREFLETDYSAFDMLISDIQMPAMNGIDVARSVREKDKEMTIIFVTNYVQYALEGYEVAAFRFLLKPLTYKAVARVAGEAVRQIHRRKEVFVSIRGKGETLRIAARDIVYAETCSGHVVLHTRQGEAECHSSMRDVETALEKHDFFRCHSAFLVNMREIQTVQQQDIRLLSGALIPLSKHRKKALKERLTVFWGDQFL